MIIKKLNILFWVRKSYVDRKGTSQLKCTISMCRDDLDFATNLLVAPKLWNQGKQYVRGTDDNAIYINDRLDKIKARIIEIKRNYEAKEKRYDLQQIKASLFVGKLIVLEQAPQQETNIIDDLTRIQDVKAQELALTTSVREKSFFNIFVRFLKNNNLHNMMSFEIGKKHILMFLDELKQKNVSNATRNKYLAFVKSVFSAMVEREMLFVNPCKSIKNLRETETKTTAFAPEHIKPLAELCKTQSSEMYFFCMFIFYLFIRPAELRRLTVGQINLEKRTVEIRPEQSKNKKYGCVLIPSVLIEKLKNSDFLKRPSNELLFSTLKNNEKYSKNAFSEKFSMLLRANDYPKEYSLYCWKHTGVVEHYKLNKDLVFLQRQCRHASLDETQKYLKSFGLYLNESLDNSPEI